MMKILDKLKKINYRHYICVLITLGFVLCSIFVFPSAFTRLVESLRDFGLSIAYYFCELFKIDHNIRPTVMAFSKVPFEMPWGLPNTWEEFEVLFELYWRAFLNKDNFLAYLTHTGQVISDGSRWVLVLALPLVLAVVIIAKVLDKHNNKYNEDTRPLVAFKKFSDKTYRPVKAWCLEFVDFVKAHKVYWVLWLVVWAYNFNFFTIVIEFFAFYYFFVITFTFKDIYRQVLKLLLDLSVVLDFIPVPIWVMIGIVIVMIIRRKIGFHRLNHYERQDRGFINERPICSMTVGTMGKKKTMSITDMALSTEVMFRDKAFEKILENDLKFPYFPWVNLENWLRCLMEYHKAYNLATVRQFVQLRRDRWIKNPTQDGIFDYDYERYGLTYDDNLAECDVWSVIETYAQLYFIYIVQSSLLISNYSIRTDNVIQDVGNFPLWDSDFFKRDSRLLDSFSRHAHILNFDTLRLGRKVVEDNADFIEFGVYVITEIGKERQNTLELKEVKKSDNTTNQKNDLFNYSLKMARHSATVDNYPFIKIFTDEQRPESWGADARDLCEVIHVQESSDMKLAMPFFFVEELLHAFLFNKFTQSYYEYRFKRSDNSLLMYFIKSVVGWFHRYYTRTYNQFGYFNVEMGVEDGTLDGTLNKKTYKIMAKKTLSRRYRTDCHGDIFTEKALGSKVGIEDLVEFVDVKATFEEMATENSYFFIDLMKIKDGQPKK